MDITYQNYQIVVSTAAYCEPIFNHILDQYSININDLTFYYMEFIKAIPLLLDKMELEDLMKSYLVCVSGRNIREYDTNIIAIRTIMKK